MQGWIDADTMTEEEYRSRMGWEDSCSDDDESVPMRDTVHRALSVLATGKDGKWINLIYFQGLSPRQAAEAQGYRSRSLSCWRDRAEPRIEACVRWIRKSETICSRRIGIQLAILNPVERQIVSQAGYGLPLTEIARRCGLGAGEAAKKKVMRRFRSALARMSDEGVREMFAAWMDTRFREGMRGVRRGTIACLPKES